MTSTPRASSVKARSDNKRSAGASASGRRDRTTDTVAAVAHLLRQAIMRGALVPGEKIRQDALAEQLGVSRIPVREALKILAANGLLEHTMNSGFSVARLNEHDFTQLYRLRRLIEEDITTPLPPWDRSLAARLRQINKDYVKASKTLEIVEMVQLTRDFHFEIFQCSDMTLMLNVLSRLWDMAAPYHSTYLFERESRERVASEQDQIISALSAGDEKAYHAVMRRHRAAIEKNLRVVLTQPIPFGRLEP